MYVYVRLVAAYYEVGVTVIGFVATYMVYALIR
jgi:hypothetical protein